MKEGLTIGILRKILAEIDEKYDDNTVVIERIHDMYFEENDWE